MSERIETKTLFVTWNEAGFVKTETKPGSTEDLEEAKENIEAIKKVSGGKRVPLLGNMTGLKAQSKAARDYYSSATEVSCAVALLVKSPMARVLGNFFIGFNRSGVPTKLFTSEEEAVKWLGDFIES